MSSNIYAQHLFYIGNDLYYYSLPSYYILNEENGKDLGFSIFTENCIQTDRKKLYVTGSANYGDDGVYSTKITNTNQAKKLSDINTTQLLLQGDFLYVFSEFTSINNLQNGNYGTWRMDLNGKNSILIFDY